MTVTMRLLIVVLSSVLLPVCLSRQADPLAWVYSWRSSLQTDATGGDCPLECDCPPSFPIAMYCDGRGLTVMPTVPSRIKYLYLQHNAIAAISDSDLANATGLTWLMMHHNQLTSDAIGPKVTPAHTTHSRHIPDTTSSNMQLRAPTSNRAAGRHRGIEADPDRNPPLFLLTTFSHVSYGVKLWRHEQPTDPTDVDWT